MEKMKPLILLLLSISSWCLSQAQPLAFHRLGVGNGLSQISVLSIAQDGQGFIWMGTRSGLNRFDGHAFRIYKAKAADSTSLASDYVLSLLKDHHGILWVGTTNGLNRYIPDSDCFQLIAGTRGKRVMTIYEDRKGGIWVGTHQGLMYCDNKRAASSPRRSSEVYGKLRGKDIRAIFTDSKDRMWFGTTEGLWRISPGAGPEGITTFNAGLPAGSPLTTIAEDGLHQVWVGTYNAGLYCFEEKKEAFLPFLHRVTDANSLINNSVRKIITDKQGRLWIGTQEGLTIHDSYTGQFRNFEHDPEDHNSLSQNSIYDLCIDEEGNTWVGTYFGGANVVYAFNTPFHSQRYTRFAPSISNNVVSGFSEDNQQVIWIGTEGGGLNWWDRKSGRFGSYRNKVGDESSLASNLVKGVSIDQSGNVWVATHRGGLSLLRAGSQRFENFKMLPGRPNAQLDLDAVLADSQGRIWVGTGNYGLLLFDPIQRSFKNFLFDSTLPFQLSGTQIRSIYEDANQQIWVTTENGVSVLQGRSAKFSDVLSSQQAPPSFQGTYNCVLRDNRGRTWLGSASRGLVLAGNQPEEWQYFDKSKGLAGNSVYGILQDAGGFLWLSTNNGLSRFDIESRKITNYNVHDGLPGNEFNFLSFFKDKRGEMFFGGFNGFTHFNPSDIQFNQRTKPVCITGLLLGSSRVTTGDSTGILKKNIGSIDRLSLTHEQNVLTLEFSALHYVKPEKTQYAWKLDGFDKNWQYSQQHNATYTNLPPGRYTFLVKAANNDGIWYDQSTKLQITIHPPVWQTWWAYTLYAMLLCAVAFFAARFLWLRARFKREASMQQFKLDFFTNISHEIRTHLSLILGPVEQLLLKNTNNHLLNKQLLPVRNNAEKLMRLVSEMMDLRKAETNHLQLHITRENLLFFLQDVLAACEGAAHARQIKLSFENHLQAPELYFDKVQMEKVFFNLLTNAVKFTPVGGRIQIVAEEDADSVSVRIIDNGIGIAAEDREKLFTTYFQVNKGQTEHAGYGIGLALAKSLVTLHKGKLTVESRPAREGLDGFTCFTVQLRKGNAHFDQPAKPPTERETRYAANESALKVQNTAADKEQEVVLLVDDNAELRAFIRESLEGKYKILEANNGNDGLALALEQIPDIILSDVMMPGLNGLELCSTLKKDVRTSHIPVILLTAKVTQEQQLEGWQIGADIYITKPFSMQMLELQIASLLASRAAMRQRYAHQVTLQPRNIEITNHDEAFLSEAIAIIDQFMEEEEFGVTMLSQKLAMSQPVLYKKLKALTDMSVNDFIKSIKLKKAAMLLLQKQLNVNEVAFRVGFNDRKYFSREFKKQFGSTPSDYAGQQDAESHREDRNTHQADSSQH